MSNEYPNITKCLQGLKGLSSKEAEAYYKICGKKSVTVNQIKEIFIEIGEDISRSKAYTVAETFRKAGLIFDVSNSSKTQEYKALHPRTLLDELKNSIKDIDPEVATLEQSYETSDFELKDPRDVSRTLRSENEIATICNVLCKDCELCIIHTDDPLLESFVTRISSCGNVNKGKTNIILFTDNADKSGVITLSKRATQGGTFRIFGQILYDTEMYDYFYKNEVEQNG